MLKMGGGEMKHDYDSDENKWMDQVIIERSEREHLRQQLQHEREARERAESRVRFCKEIIDFLETNNQSWEEKFNKLLEVLRSLYSEAECHADRSKHLNKACEEARQILEIEVKKI